MDVLYLTRTQVLDELDFRVVGLPHEGRLGSRFVTIRGVVRRTREPRPLPAGEHVGCIII